MFMLLLAVIIIFAVYLYSKKRHSDLSERYASILSKYNDNAFRTSSEDKDDGSCVCIRLADEMVSSGGKRAVSMQRPDRYSGVPLHEINQNGTFSSRQPYFISKYSHKWNRSGKRHVIQTLRSKTNSLFKTSNQTPGAIQEIGMKILEYDTYKFPPITLNDMDYMFKAAEKYPELNQLLTARINNERYTYQGSPYNLMFMSGAW
jgi:hypothetical protein